MPELERNLFGWLMHLLTEAARFLEQNKMTAHNLALVVAPQIAGMNAEDPLSSIIETQKVHHIIKFHIEHLLLQKYNIHSSPSSPNNTGLDAASRQLQRLAHTLPSSSPPSSTTTTKAPTTNSSRSSNANRESHAKEPIPVFVAEKAEKQV